jgi:xylitol oxidase
MVSVAALPRTMDVDTGRSTVTVSAGIRYGELGQYLHNSGYALHNLASLPHISIAGACATGTHGSGDGNGSLATAVSAIEMITADGDLVTLRRDADGETFRGAVVALGALGIVTRLTLDIVPTFDIAQIVYEDLSRERLDAHWAEIFAGGYSVSLFTDWTSSRFNLVWRKYRLDGASVPARAQPWMGATPADAARHPVFGAPPETCTEQLGVPGAWHRRLPHFQLGFTPSSGEELQTEYLVAREHLVDALTAIDGIRDRIAPLLLTSEVRTVAADDLWLSPSYQRDSAAIHFTWRQDMPAVMAVLVDIEKRIAPLRARPHWGKVFCTDPETISGLYDRLPDFVALLQRYDPNGKFRNEFINRIFPSRSGNG